MSLKESVRTAVKVKTAFDELEQYRIANQETLLDSITLARQIRFSHNMPAASLEHDKEYCIQLRSQLLLKRLRK